MEILLFITFTTVTPKYAIKYVEQNSNIWIDEHRLHMNSFDIYILCIV